MGSIPGPGRAHMPQSLKPKHHNYWAGSLVARALQQEKPAWWHAHMPQLEKTRSRQWRPGTAINKINQVKIQGGGTVTGHEIQRHKRKEKKLI